MLEDARRLGFLGPGPVETHLDHAGGFAEAWRVAAQPVEGVAARAADLGSGAGLPGLPLALALTWCSWVLVEAGVRRAAFLRAAVERLGLTGRVEVAEERAEVLGRHPAHRGGYDLVVARSFAAPPVLAECAAPLLRVGGRAIVSEPPGGSPARWPAAGLQQLGLAAEMAVVAGGGAFQVLRMERECPARFPRRVGVPAKRPVF